MPTGTVKSSLYPRHSEPRLLEALADSPVVLIHGPRQCGNFGRDRQLQNRALREQLGLEPEPAPIGRRVQGAA